MKVYIQKIIAENILQKKIPYPSVKETENMCIAAPHPTWNKHLKEGCANDVESFPQNSKCTAAAKAPLLNYQMGAKSTNKWNNFVLKRK